MCHGDESLPPASPGARPGARGASVVCEAHDGNRFAAHAASAAVPTGKGVVILPDVRGLHDFYRALAERFAEVGIDAIAVDYFGRTAGPGRREDPFDFRHHADRTTADGVTADVDAAVRYLRSPDGGGVRSVWTVGFCFGGGHSWRLAADLDGLDGAVGFYGRPSLAAGVIGRTHAPLLLLVAGADEQIPIADVTAFADAVRDAGGSAECVVYADAPHSFFDRTSAEHRAACDDAWSRIVGFMDRTRASS